MLVALSWEGVPLIPIKWVTEITHVVDKKYFVDEQRFGPYSFWHHKHFIKEIDGEFDLPMPSQ